MNPFTKFDIPKARVAGFGLPNLGGLRGGGDGAARMREALAQVQRRQAASYARWAEACRAARGAAGDAGPFGATLDMEPPAGAGGAWTAPGADPGGPAEPPRGADLSALMRRLRDGLPDGMPPASPVPVPLGARFEARTYAGAAGSRSYKVYVPSGYIGQPLPVVVMLHGCTQNPDDFATGTRMNAVAEAATFLVAYPEQPRSANPQRCWNWYAEGDQRRESGEPALIAGIAGAVVREFSADPARVYVAGLSAGGAMAAILAGTHPDVFAAVGVHSGLACGAARDVPSAFAAMKGGGGPLAHHRSAVPTIVFHGTDDRTVHPINGERVAAQARAGSEHPETVVEGRTPDGVGYTRTVRTDACGRTVSEHWIVRGAGHAWSGGDEAGSFADARGPDASREMARFFLAHANAGARR